MIPKIGDLHEGGIVYYVDEVLGKGLICSVSTPTNQKWMSGLTLDYPSVGETSQELWTGQENTRKIVEYQGTSLMYAARYCAEYSFANFNDWYLPSVEELKLMFYHREMLGMISGSWFWSSSEFDIEDSYIVVTSSENIVSTNKKYADFFVKPIRTFTFEPEGVKPKTIIKQGSDLKKYNSAIQKDFELDSIQSFLDDADNDLIIPYIGRPTFTLIAEAEEPAGLQKTLFDLLAKAEVNYAIAQYTSSGSVNITDAGISVSKTEKTLPASDKKLVALKSDSLEKAYNALALAIEYLEANKATFTDYATSVERKLNRSLFILSAKEFQLSGVSISNSAQLFESLKTYQRNAEQKAETILGASITAMVRTAILENNADQKTQALIDKIRRPVAFATMAEAILLKTVSVTPNGVFTTSHTDGGSGTNIENRTTAPDKLLNSMLFHLQNHTDNAFAALKNFLIENASDYGYTIEENVNINDFPDRNSYYL